ncbi:MAG: DinB family protein [Rhodospirillales bacterium]
MQSQFATLARYNAWANRWLYDACAQLPAAAYRQDRGAFFGSIHCTLDHILWVDRLWFGRITGNPNPVQAPGEQVYECRSELRAAREDEDQKIVAVVDGIAPKRLDEDLRYVTLEGGERRTRLSLILTDVFNHQTHHRGQVHTMLTQAGVAAPDLDLIEFLYPTG